LALLGDGGADTTAPAKPKKGGKKGKVEEAQTPPAEVIPGAEKVKSLTFFSEQEYDTMAAATAVAAQDPKGGVLTAATMKGAIKKALKSATVKDLADVALYGRMVASDKTLSMESSVSSSHALSVHAAEVEADYFSALDDLQPEEKSGAAHLDATEFGSATYYRYYCINVDLLEQNLGPHVSDKEVQIILEACIRATVDAIPTGRSTKFNSDCSPQYIIAVVRRGQNQSLLDAFSIPVESVKGYDIKAIQRLEYALTSVKRFNGIKNSQEFRAAKYPELHEADSSKTYLSVEDLASQAVAAAIKE
jgi:CRISPR system Cascade subunit CasC